MACEKKKPVEAFAEEATTWKQRGHSSVEEPWRPRSPDPDRPGQPPRWRRDICMVCNTKRQASEMKAAAKACLGRRQKGVDGFVYAVTNPAWPGLVKLGSAVDLNKRLTSYQTSCPHRAFRVEASAFVDDRIKEEKALMALFKPNQHLNEWFRLDVAVVVRVLESIRNRRSSHVEAVP